MVSYAQPCTVFIFVMLAITAMAVDGPPQPAWRRHTSEEWQPLPANLKDRINKIEVSTSTVTVTAVGPTMTAQAA